MWAVLFVAPVVAAFTTTNVPPGRKPWQFGRRPNHAMAAQRGSNRVDDQLNEVAQLLEQLLGRPGNQSSRLLFRVVPGRPLLTSLDVFRCRVGLQHS